MNAIKDVFSQDINRRIEKVIHYHDDEMGLLKQEVEEYVVTKNIEASAERLLDLLDDGFQNPTNREIGVWVDGFYGSGKSSMTKYLGYSLDPTRKIGDVRFVDLFKTRITNQPLQQRLVTVANRHKPAVIMIDLSTAASGGVVGQPISGIVFQRVLLWAGYSIVTKHALLELQLEEDGKTQQFLEAIRERDREWDEIKNSQVIGGGLAAQAAMEIYPDVFPTEAAFSALKIGDGDEDMDHMVRRIIELVRRRTGSKNLIIILDEAGMYAAHNNGLVINLMGLAQNFKTIGKGQAWIIATAQQTLTETVDPLNAPNLFKLKDRFPISVQLRADDIRLITHRRLLAKSAAAQQHLGELFDRHGDKLKVQVRLENAKGYSANVDKAQFVELYPFLPQHFDLMMNVIARLARRTGGTGLRSAIKVVQETLIGMQGGAAFADRPLGALVTLMTLYDVLRRDIDGGVGFKHVVGAVDKAQSRFGADSLEAQVAKAVAVMQPLDDFPLSRANLAALMVDRVDAQANLTEINKAIDVLIADPGVPLAEIDGRLRFLSDRSAELQRQWSEIQPNSNDQRQLLATIVRDSVIPADPKAQIHGSKQIRAHVVLTYRDASRTLSASTGDVEVQLRVVPKALFAAARQQANTESLAPDAKGRIVAIAGVDPAIDELLRDSFATSKMQLQLQARALDADETEFARSLEVQNTRLRQAVADQLHTTLADGSVIYRGIDVPIKHGASSFEAALGAALKKVGEELFDRYPHAGVTPNAAAAEKILKAKDLSTITSAEDPLALLTGGSGGGAHTGHPAVVDIQQYLNTHGAVDGKTIMEAFAAQPYGWNKDVTRYILAAMFITSQVQIRINGRPYSTADQTVVNAFASIGALAHVGFDSPPKPLDGEVLLSAKTVLTELTGEKVSPLQPNLESAAKGVLTAALADADAALSHARALQLPIATTLADVPAEFRTMQSADAQTLIKSFAAADAGIAGRVRQVRHLKGLLGGDFGALIKRLRKAFNQLTELSSSGTYGNLHQAAAPLREEVEEHLSHLDLAAQHARLQAIEQELIAAVKQAVQQESTTLPAEMGQAVVQLEQSTAWNSLPPALREPVTPALAKLREPELPADADPFKQIAALYQTRFTLLNKLVHVQQQVEKLAKESVTPPDPTVPALTIPGHPLRKPEALAHLIKLQAQVAELAPDAEVRFQIGG